LCLAFLFVLSRARDNSEFCFIMEGMRFEEALKLIESGQPLMIEYVSYDKSRKTGGEVKIQQLRICSPKEERPKQAPTNPKSGVSNHFENFTRSFYTCINGEITQAIRKIHLPLILSINYQKVML
jgi:hypothetical protein